MNAIIADRIAKYARQLGWSTQINYSNSSDSVYVTCERPDVLNLVKIRISDHPLPPSYRKISGQSHFEVGSHDEANGSWAEAIAWIADEDQKLPPPVKASLTRSGSTATAGGREHEEVERDRVLRESSERVNREIQIEQEIIIPYLARRGILKDNLKWRDWKKEVRKAKFELGL